MTRAPFFPKKNDPTLQCHIFKDIEFDVFKVSTVIQNWLKYCTERFYVITSTHSNYAGTVDSRLFEPALIRIIRLFEVR